MRSIKTKHFVFHPLSYGTATLARIGLRRADGRAIMFHYFPPHEASTFHDHPWHFTTLVLWGAYDDVTPCGECAGRGYVTERELTGGRRRPYRVTAYGCCRCGGSGELSDRVNALERRFRPARHRHKTNVRRRTFTVVVTGPVEREWCEGTPEEWFCGGVPEDFAAGLGVRR